MSSNSDSYLASLGIISAVGVDDNTIGQQPIIPDVSSTSVTQILLPTCSPGLIGLLEWLAGTFGISTGLLLLILFKILWQFRHLIFAFIANYFDFRILSRRNVQFEFTYIARLGDEVVSQITLSNSDHCEIELEQVDENPIAIPLIETSLREAHLITLSEEVNLEPSVLDHLELSVPQMFPGSSYF